MLTRPKLWHSLALLIVAYFLLPPLLFVAIFFCVVICHNLLPPRKEFSLLDVLDGSVRKDQLSKTIFEKVDNQKVKQAFQSAVVELPPVEEVSPPRFSVQDTDALVYLDKHGYVVFKDVLNKDEILKARDLLWEFLGNASNTEIKRDDVETWSNKHWPGGRQTGIVTSDGIGQSPFMWYVRGIPKVKQAFATSWETDDLLVSFDGCGLFRPWKYDRSWATQGGWYHVDQNHNILSGKQAIQGLVNLYDSDSKTGGLVVIPNSHLLHKEIAARRGTKGTSHFVYIRLDDPVLQQPGQLIKASAGDLLLWDSRTVHCNTPALTLVSQSNGLDQKDQKDQNLIDQKEHNWDILRAVAYVCMAPTAMAKGSVIEDRIDAVKRGQGTNHWPQNFEPVGPPHDWKIFDTLSKEQIQLITGNKYKPHSSKSSSTQPKTKQKLGMKQSGGDKSTTTKRTVHVTPTTPIQTVE